MFAIAWTVGFGAVVGATAVVELVARDWHAHRMQVALRDDHREAMFAAWLAS